MNSLKVLYLPQRAFRQFHDYTTPRTIGTIFVKLARPHPSRPSLHSQINGAHAEVDLFLHALLTSGERIYDSICVFGDVTGQWRCPCTAVCAACHYPVEEYFNRREERCGVHGARAVSLGRELSKHQERRVPTSWRTL